MSTLPNLLEMQILGPTSELLSQKIWRWGPAICVVTSPAVIPTCAKSLRPTGPVGCAEALKSADVGFKSELVHLPNCDMSKLLDPSRASKLSSVKGR